MTIEIFSNNFKHELGTDHFPSRSKSLAVSGCLIGLNILSNKFSFLVSV